MFLTFGLISLCIYRADMSLCKPPSPSPHPSLSFYLAFTLPPSLPILIRFPLQSSPLSSRSHFYFTPLAICTGFQNACLSSRRLSSVECHPRQFSQTFLSRTSKMNLKSNSLFFASSKWPLFADYAPFTFSFNPPPPFSGLLLWPR